MTRKREPFSAGLLAMLWLAYLVLRGVILIGLVAAGVYVGSKIAQGSTLYTQPCPSGMVCARSFQQAALPARKMLPTQKVLKVVRSYTARITIYQSTPGQTDADPFTTANGDRVHWGGVAVNCVPFGTKLRLPKVFGKQVFKVNDRGSMPCGDVDVWVEIDDFHGWKGTTRSVVEIVR